MTAWMLAEVLITQDEPRRSQAAARDSFGKSVQPFTE
jgi:hypothetical protein